jgi:CRP-like cAMP-binding protein
LPPSSNQLIARLPKTAQARLTAIGQLVDLPLSHVMGEPGSPTRHVHFPLEGFVSLLAQVDDKHAIEVGMVGREGMLGVQLLLGVAREPLKSLVQGEGRALRIDAAAFRRELAASATLRTTLDRYVYVLARWLLMSQDRASSDVFRLTQEFLAYMLGVRRVGVTVAAGQLQRRNLIAYERGEMRIIDRAGLEQAACTCYASDRAVYAGNLG